MFHHLRADLEDLQRVQLPELRQHVERLRDRAGQNAARSDATEEDQTAEAMTIVMVSKLDQLERLVERQLRRMLSLSAGATIFVLAFLAGATPVHAEPLAPLQVATTWSSRGGPSAGLVLVHRIGTPVAVYGAAGVNLDHVGAEGAAPRLEGVAGSRLGAGVALVRSFALGARFAGHVLAAVEVGVADVRWLGIAGAHLVLDLDLARLYADALVFAAPSWPTVYSFGAFVCPYPFPWVRPLLWYDCDSRDGSTEERAKPCGLGAALQVTPSWRWSLRLAGKATFHDLAGQLGDVGGRVLLIASVTL